MRYVRQLGAPCSTVTRKAAMQTPDLSAPPWTRIPITPVAYTRASAWEYEEQGGWKVTHASTRHKLEEARRRLSRTIEVWSSRELGEKYRFDLKKLEQKCLRNFEGE